MGAIRHVHVKCLETEEYDPATLRWKYEKVRHPDWGAIERTIRRLDGFQYPCVRLWATDDEGHQTLDGVGEVLEVVGGGACGGWPGRSAGTSSGGWTTPGGGISGLCSSGVTWGSRTPSGTSAGIWRRSSGRCGTMRSTAGSTRRSRGARGCSAEPAAATDRPTPGTSEAAHARIRRLPILADALEDAGCNDADILNHCRSDGPHVRGCWAVDLELGKG
jgi:hypothetical protein